MKEKHFCFDKNWLVFPLAVVWKTDIYELVGRASRLEIHFLFWHWKWTFIEEE